MKNWRRLGFVTEPKSSKQGKLALNARTLLEPLLCFLEVKILMLHNRPTSEISQFIFSKNEGPVAGLTRGTVDKYVQIYRKFFLTPVEYAITNAEKKPAESSDMRTIAWQKLGLLPEKLAQIEAMEEVAKIQMERCREQYALEKKLGLPLPTLGEELKKCTELNSRILELKMDLGLLKRAPAKIIMDGRILTNDLPPEAKEELVEFGKMLFEMIEASRRKRLFPLPIDVLGVSANNGKQKLN
jgi:hypothetical protein